MSLRFQSASFDGLWLDGQWDAGVAVLLGRWEDGLRQFCELAWGGTRPAAGVVTLGGKPIFNRPTLRASIGTLSRREAPSPASAVARVEALQRLHATATKSVGPVEALGRVGLSRLVDSSGPITERDARGVALATALGLETPACVVLYDPLGVPGCDVAAVATRLQELGGEIPVLVCSERLGDAVRLGADVYEFRGQRMVSGPLRPESLLHPAGAHFRASVSNGPKLLPALLNCPSVDAVDAPLEKNTLEIKGTNPSETSLAILGACAQTDVTLFTLAEVGAASSPSSPLASNGGSGG